jgi:hypothetical protein
MTDGHTGDGVVIEQGREEDQTVTHTTEVCEVTLGDGSDPAGSLDHFRSIGPGVGAFRFRVTSVQSMLKRSQELSEDSRERLIKRLSDSLAGTARILRT